MTNHLWFCAGSKTRNLSPSASHQGTRDACCQRCREGTQFSSLPTYRGVLECRSGSGCNPASKVYSLRRSGEKPPPGHTCLASFYACITAPAVTHQLDLWWPQQMKKLAGEELQSSPTSPHSPSPPPIPGVHCRGS